MSNIVARAELKSHDLTSPLLDEPVECEQLDSGDVLDVQASCRLVRVGIHMYGGCTKLLNADWIALPAM